MTKALSRQSFVKYSEATKAYVNNDTSRFKQLLNTELSQAEKQLLRARVKMQRAQLSEARILLKTLSDPAEIFLRAEKYTLLATVESRAGKFESAVANNLQAYNLFGQLKDVRGSFIATFNLSVDFARLDHSQLSKYYLDLAHGYAVSDSERTLVLRALATQASQNKDYEKAILYLEQALDGEIAEADRTTLYIICADIYVRAGKLDSALESYQKFSSKEVFPEMARANFERQCLRFLTQNVSWPLPSTELEEKCEYYWKWMVLRHLDQGELKEAELAWIELQKILPRFIGRDFSVSRASEESSLFARSLNQLKVNVPTEQSPPPLLSPRLKALLKLFEKLKMPMRKEEIIEKLWMCDYDPTFDARFYKLLSRARQLSKVHIELKNRRYRIFRT